MASKTKPPINKSTIARHLKAVQAKLDAMSNYTTHDDAAFESGELYGMRNVLSWVMGEEVASPTQILNHEREA